MNAIRSKSVLLATAALSIFALLGGSTTVAFAEGAECHVSTDLGHTSQGCVRSGSETNAYITSHSDHTYSIRPACEIGGLALCAEPGHCNIEGHEGNLFNVYEDSTPEPLDWQAGP